MAVQLAEPLDLLLTFDVGGSHVAAGLCNLKTLQSIRRASAPLPPKPTLEEFLSVLQTLCNEMVASPQEVAGAALAIPGPFDYDVGISHMRHKLEGLYERDLRQALADRFGWIPKRIRFLNDAEAFLLGEVGAGAAQGAKRAIGIALGTGIGSAFAQNGRIVTEGKGVPPGGEIWNLPYRNGTVEDLLSTRALQLDYATRTGRQEEVFTIAAAAATDPDARIVFEIFGRNLGQVFRDILAPFAPDIVVIGGGISRSAPLFLPVARQQLEGLDFRLLTSRLLVHAPLIGAAVFWRDSNVSTQEPALQEAGSSGSLTDAM